MKKLLVVMLVLSMASMANAALWITVNGGTDDVEIMGSAAVITIDGDGATAPNTFFLGIDIVSDGDGAIGIDSAVVNYTGSDAAISWAELGPEAFGWNRYDVATLSLGDRGMP